MGRPKKRGRAARRGAAPHADAAFTPDERAALLLGVRVPCRSSWVHAALWDEESANLVLTLGTRDYDFPGVDTDAAEEFAAYPSKGIWYHNVWIGRMGRAAPAGAPEPGTRAWEAGEGRRPPKRVPTAPWD